MSGKKSVGKRIWNEVKVFLFAAIVIAIIIGALFAYSGIWPPMVVVESGSMEHSEDESFIGIIDTGDMVIVQDRDHSSSVTTYVEGYDSDHETYGDYGDVVIYERYGSSAETPVIHRAIILLVYNETSSSFDVPSLEDYPADRWSHDGISDGQWWNLSGVLTLYDVGYRDMDVVIPLDNLVKYGHGGLITKGDHNDMIDQNALAPICREPIEDDWIVGVARGEIPWFGLIKLWVSGQYSPYDTNTPANSWTSLFVSIFLIIAIPIALDITNILLKRRGIDLWARFKSRISRLIKEDKKEIPPQKGDKGKKKD